MYHHCLQHYTGHDLRDTTSNIPPPTYIEPNRPPHSSDFTHRAGHHHYYYVCNTTPKMLPPAPESIQPYISAPRLNTTLKTHAITLNTQATNTTYKTLTPTASLTTRSRLPFSNRHSSRRHHSLSIIWSNPVITKSTRKGGEEALSHLESTLHLPRKLHCHLHPQYPNRRSKLRTQTPPCAQR